MDLRLRHWILMAPLAQSTTTFSRCAGRNFVQIKLPMIDVAGAQEINRITLDRLLLLFWLNWFVFSTKRQPVTRTSNETSNMCTHLCVYQTMDVYCSHMDLSRLVEQSIILNSAEIINTRFYTRLNSLYLLAYTLYHLISNKDTLSCTDLNSSPAYTPDYTPD